MMQLVGEHSVVVGIDVHKYSHQAVALSRFGQQLSSLSFSNDELDTCLNWLQSLGEKDNLIIALEDMNGLGMHLANALQAAGFILRYVPAIYTEKARKRSVHRDKNDVLDAMRVGKVILTEEETLPALSILPQEKKEIRNLDLLLQEKDELTRNQTILKNQLHVLLHQYFGNSYKQGKEKIFTKQNIRFYKEEVEKTSISQEHATAYLSQGILRRLNRLTLTQEQLQEIVHSIETAGKDMPAVSFLVEKLPGCGTLTASKIIVEIEHIKRFKTEAKLAKYAGIAPVQSQSGRKNKYHTNPSGNRKLNKAIHTIALSQIGNRGPTEAKEFYQKKLKEGKSKLWAIRCLKRYITRRIFTLLNNY